MILPLHSHVSEIVVSSENQNLRLDKVLALHPDIQTRSKAEKLISASRVRMDGQVLKASHRCAAGERLQIYWPQAKSSSLEPWDFPLDIIHEDHSVIVVNKPAGIVVHPSAGHTEHTLVHALLAHTQSLSMGFNELRPGIVHRLDKDTSGLIVIAKTDSAHRALADQFRAKTAYRIYWALAVGVPKVASGHIETQLARHPQDRKRFAAFSLQSGKGKYASTRYRLLQSAHGVSWLKCQLQTGRTHQIRVHLSNMGHPIVGDTLYGAQSRTKQIPSVRIRQVLLGLNRIGLHARSLGFTHPDTKKEMKFEVNWPSDLIEVVNGLGFSV